MTGRLLAGTSGWMYDGWKGPFYPDDLPKREWLAFYAERFPAVEVNNTFYQLPKEKALVAWRDATPDGFRFAVKGSRYVTHRKKLKDADEIVPRFLRAVRPLGDKLGPVLWQLPGNWRYDRERLRAFLDALPGGAHALELRDRRWVNDDAFALLEEAGVAFAIDDFDRDPTPNRRTAPFAYVRFHGADGHYGGSYDDDTMRTWRRRVGQWRGKGRDVWAFFNNDKGAVAPGDARRFLT